MKVLKIGLASLVLAVLVAGYLVVAKAEPAKAQTNLGDLIVVNGLFSDFNTRGLAGLIAVDNLTNDGGVGTMGTGDLGDLIVLNGLFGNGNASNLAGLIAVSNIAGRGGF